MNLNFFKSKETKINNPVEEVKNPTEIETSPEEEISPERIESLKGFENEIQEINKLDEKDLVETIESPEARKALAEKLILLSKVGDFLKEQWPAIAATTVTLAGIAVSLDASSDWAAQHGTQLVDSAYMGAEKITSLIASTVSAFGMIASGLLYIARKDQTI